MYKLPGEVVWNELEQLTKKYAAQGCELIVFPESFIPGYPRGFSFGAKIGSRTDAGRKLYAEYRRNSFDLEGDELKRLEKLAYSRMELEDDSARIFGSSPVTIELGTFADQSSQIMLKKLFSEAGKVVAGSSLGKLALQTTEAHANQALAYARSIGLVTAFIR